MTKKEIKSFAHLYYPYSKNKKWVAWFVKTAPVKAKRNIIILQQYKKNAKKVLDFGCGIGFNTYYLSESFPHTIGIDIDKESITLGNATLRKIKNSIKLRHFDGEKIPFNNETFDIVVSNDVWEHAENPQAMLKEASRVLKKEGILLINTPNKLWPIETHYKLPFLSYLPSFIADIYVQFTKKGKQYHDIHLPTYKVFKRSMEKYFIPEDITLDLLLNYQKYSLDKERGQIVVWAHTLLQILEKTKKIPFGFLFYALGIYLLQNFSVGWVFICKKKVKNT